VQVALDPERFEALGGFPLEPERVTVFLCGNPAMIADVRALLEGRGFTLDRRQAPGSIRLERYW
jgi:ferredoxin--NADP+ reductase